MGPSVPFIYPRIRARPVSMEIVCGKCGARITEMKMLKPLRGVVGQFDGKCPSCGHQLSPSEFSFDVQD